MRKIILLNTILMTAMLAGCAASEEEDVKDWMTQQTKTLRGKIDALPDAKSYIAVPFKATASPFVEKEVVSLADIAKNKFAPDMSRRKEPLEAFPLETLRMTGYLKQGGKDFAIIKTRDNATYSVEVGNYLGNNYGLIKSISESEIILEERVQEFDEWKLREGRVELSENTNKR